MANTENIPIIPEAKKAVSQVLDSLQRQLENEAASRLGGTANQNPGLAGDGGNNGYMTGSGSRGQDSPL